MRKPAFHICENKDEDQLCGNCTADQRLCFGYIDSTIAVQPGLCRTWLETPKTGFLATRLILSARTKGEGRTKTDIEPRCEKTGLRGFRPGPTQTGLYNHTKWLEA